MTLILSPVVAEDLETIARIHRESFATSSPFMQQVFAGARKEDVDASTIRRLTPILKDPGDTLLKATLDGQILGYAHWCLPREAGAAPPKETPRLPYPDGVIVNLADEFLGAIKARGEELNKGPPFYHLHILAVDPTAFKKGAGSDLLQWGLDRADKEGVDVHLEATEAGLALYDRRGFIRAAPNIVTGPEGQYILVPVVRARKSLEV